MFPRRPDDTVRMTRREAGRLAVAVGLLVVTLTAILGLDLTPARPDLAVGDLVPADIRATRALSFTNEILTDEARQAARNAVPPQYDFTSERAIAIAADQVATFERIVRPVDTAFSASVTPEQRVAILGQVLPILTDDGRATLLTLEPDRWTALRAEAAGVLDAIERTELRDTEVALTRVRAAELMAGGLSDAERHLAAEFIAPLIVANSSFSETATAIEEDRQANAVQAVVERFVSGEVIVRGGSKLTETDAARIAAFGLDGDTLDVAELGGWFALSALLVGLLLGWIWRFRRSFWHRNNVLLLLGLLLVFSTLAVTLTAGRAALPFILPLAAVGILVAVLLDAEAATILMAVVAVIAGAVNGPSLELTTYVFLGGLAGILVVRRGDRFAAYLQAGVAIAVVNAAVIVTFSLLGERDTTGLAQLIGASALAAGGSAVAAVGSFAVLGNLFGILTVFQLLELANPSQPLLRRLLIETPGTYHHSLMVGNLAERAAEAIGADPLLTRVAAYYHDVGKLANPAAFIENQAGGLNLHDELEPDVSAQVLKDHVADGIDLAYEARLPKALIAFIPQHHGTARISYFHAKARDQAAEPYGGVATSEGRKAAETVNEGRFRHAGPKPQSREAALIMLADGVEASVRSLTSRDEPTIRAMVARIIAERMDDRQFEECDLTLRDIDRIEDAFVGQLLGMYHQRIAYPQSRIVELESRRAAAGGGGGSSGSSTTGTGGASAARPDRDR